MKLNMKLKEIRKSKHFTQQDVAEKLNCDVTTYARYENGDGTPPLEILIKLSEVFNVSLDYLVGRQSFNESRLTPKERAILSASQNADERATDDAIMIRKPLIMCASL